MIYNIRLHKRRLFCKNLLVQGDVYNLSMPCSYRHEIDDDQIKYGGECCDTVLSGMTNFFS